MEIRYNVTGAERKRLAETIAEILECDAKYMGVPTFAYKVDYYTIDKQGVLSFDDSADTEEVEQLIEALAERGFETEVAIEDSEEEQGLEHQPDDHAGEDNVNEVEDSIVFSWPREYISDAALENLRRLVKSKESLIKKALGAEALPIEDDGEKVSLPWFKGHRQIEEITAYSIFVGKLIDMAKTQKRVMAKEKASANDKYAFRCFLLRLGFIGSEYKETRKVLLRNLSGSSAFKSGQKKGFSSEDLNQAKSDLEVRTEINAILNGEDVASNEE